DDYINSTQDPDLYYVDGDTHGQHGDYIVALLHYLSGDREDEKPVSIRDSSFKKRYNHLYLKCKYQERRATSGAPPATVEPSIPVPPLGATNSLNHPKRGAKK
ncbi:6434_t:CDS:2, partial [Acaulospora colombiana]